jgi:hypothetical protein
MNSITDIDLDRATLEGSEVAALTCNRELHWYQLIERRDFSIGNACPVRF